MWNKVTSKAILDFMLKKEKDLIKELKSVRAEIKKYKLELKKRKKHG